MKTYEFDNWCRSFLDVDDMAGVDISLNGLQIGDLDQKVEKLAFAVDGCLETIQKAVDEKADLLFVHHGLFWGKPLAIQGDHYKRVRCAIENKLSLYAVHLPLDMHPEYGNNAGLARVLGLVETEGFSDYKGFKIGIQGRFPEPVARDSIIPSLFGDWEKNARMLPFGKEKIETVGIMSGGGTHDLPDAIEAGLDLYITGDSSHQLYHQALEAGINVAFAGHYLTEVCGVQSIQKKVEEELGLETIFIDVPTGL